MSPLVSVFDPSPAANKKLTLSVRWSNVCPQYTSQSRPPPQPTCLHINILLSLSPVYRRAALSFNSAGHVLKG